MNIIKHDLIKTLYVVKNYIDTGESEKANAQLTDILGSVETSLQAVVTGNHLIDSVLNNISSRCNECAIAFKYHIDMQVLEVVNEYDLSVLLMNALDNAITNISRDNKRIHLVISISDQMILITIENSVDGDILQANPDLMTTKKDKNSHGYGIASMKLTAQKYNGNIVYSQQDNMFCCMIMLMAD